jgi:AbrB family looped-hinge helix DNA binding protein
VKIAISTKGQIVIPVGIREKDGIEPGQEFELERIDRGEYRLTRLSLRANEGVVDWLLACPQKGFFTAIESESTDDRTSATSRSIP